MVRDKNGRMQDMPNNIIQMGVIRKASMATEIHKHTHNFTSKLDKMVNGYLCMSKTNGKTMCS